MKILSWLFTLAATVCLALAIVDDIGDQPEPELVIENRALELQNGVVGKKNEIDVVIRNPASVPIRVVGAADC
jgi:hypothetical protein